MSQKWRKYSPDFRREALEKMKACANVAALARELGIRRKWLYAWKRAAAQAGVSQAGPVAGRPPDVTRWRKKVSELEALVARQSLELSFFKGALQRIEEQRRKREATSGTGSTSKSER
jgi:transposase-like protein